MAAFDPASEHKNGDGASHVASGRSRSDRLPPFNAEAEQGVLGSVLLQASVMNEVAMILKAADFYRDGHQQVYEAMLSLCNDGKPIDLMTVAEVLGNRLERLGGMVFLGELADSVPHAANAKYYAQIVRQKAIGRELISAATESLDEVYSNDFTAEHLVEAAEKRIFAISEADCGQDTLILDELIDLAIDQISDREQGRRGVLTGFPDVDHITHGFRPGNLVIIAARPSIGKTAFALNIAENAVMAEPSLPTLFVSLEMSRGEVGERLLSSRSGVSGDRFKVPGNLTIEDKQAIGDAMRELRGAPLYIDDTPSRNMTQIAANARRLKSRYGLGLIIVDYIQLIDGQRKGSENRQEEVSRISKRLKILAREIQVPVMVLAQLNRESEKREDRRPRLADLRESGQIEADADIVMLLHRPEFYEATDRPGEADLFIAKNRNGATGPVRLGFEKECTRFVPRANPDLHEAGGY